MDDPITNADKLSNYILLYGFNIVFPKLNIVSEVFKSSFGFHILEVLDRRKKDISNELQKDKAFKIIFERKYEEQLERTLQELRAESYVDIKINI